MAEKDKPGATISIPALKSGSARPQAHILAKQPTPMRTQQELTPLAQRIAQNAELMQRFFAVIGAEDKERAAAVIDEVTKLAQSLDPSITVSEGTRIVIALMKMVGHPKDHIK